MVHLIFPQNNAEPGDLVWSTRVKWCCRLWCKVGFPSRQLKEHTSFTHSGFFSHPYSLPPQDTWFKAPACMYFCLGFVKTLRFSAASHLWSSLSRFCPTFFSKLVLAVLQLLPLPTAHNFLPQPASSDLPSCLRPLFLPHSVLCAFKLFPFLST